MVREKKLKAVEEMKKIIEKYPVIGILDMHKLPAKQLQEIKKRLRGKAFIIMTKKSTLTHAIRNSNKEKITELEKFIPLQPALIFTETEPFKFYSIVDKLKSFSFAKEGDVTEEEITLTAGPTSLLPGPAISEFSKLGISVGVEEGKIAIKKDKIVAKKGDVISKELASVLRKLRIEPIKIGLNVVVLYYNGIIYTKDVLNLVNIYPEKLKEAFNQALNLSVAICYPTKENINYLLAKAFNNAKALESKIGGVK